MARDSPLFSNTWCWTWRKFSQIFPLRAHKDTSKHVCSVCLKLQSFGSVSSIAKKIHYITDFFILLPLNGLSSVSKLRLADHTKRFNCTGCYRDKTWSWRVTQGPLSETPITTLYDTWHHSLGQLTPLSETPDTTLGTPDFTLWNTYHPSLGHRTTLSETLITTLWDTWQHSLNHISPPSGTPDNTLWTTYHHPLGHLTTLSGPPNTTLWDTWHHSLGHLTPLFVRKSSVTSIQYRIKIWAFCMTYLR